MRAFLIVSVLLLSSCASGTAGTCQNPVASACSEKVQEAAPVLAKIALEQNRTPAEVAVEAETACESALQNDLDETIADLEIIAADGGAR